MADQPKQEATAVAVARKEGHLRWLMEQGTEFVTVHHIAELSHCRVSDIEFILSCEGIPVDPRLHTVRIADVLARWTDS